jgi:hypothetical protein
MRSLDEIFEALAASPFRTRFRLGPKERAYLDEHGCEAIAGHARRIARERLGAAQPKNDGRQTPMRGHPVFTAQHATATCCRGCLAKWHGIPAGAPLSDADLEHIVAAVVRWLSQDRPLAPAPRASRRDKQLKLDL